MGPGTLAWERRALRQAGCGCGLTDSDDVDQGKSGCRGTSQFAVDARHPVEPCVRARIDDDSCAAPGLDEDREGTGALGLEYLEAPDEGIKVDGACRAVSRVLQHGKRVASPAGRVLGEASRLVSIV
jgi:hypothetical protein